MMSRHTSRRERWTEISAKEHRSAFGWVRYRAGAWEGTVVYEKRDEQGLWHEMNEQVGRFKRPRNAMIAVEDKAREISRRNGEMVKVEIDD
jgi:hypothetical protein